MIQSVLISNKVFPDPYEAGEWIKSHGFKIKKMDATSKYWRFRQKNPIDGAQYRTKKIAKGIKLVLMY